MTDHWSGNDPAAGCGLMMVAGSSGLIGFIVGVLVGWLLWSA